ncbi:hypothetical protein [Sphingomonas sp. DC2300-3]|uniref:hypothetical protein n=2 Tax=unclassified Sphingomonas TaxID=196159 RepID=UPI003CF957EF
MRSRGFRQATRKNCWPNCLLTRPMRRRLRRPRLRPAFRPPASARQSLDQGSIDRRPGMTRSPQTYLAATRRLRDEFVARGYYAKLHQSIRAAMAGFAPLPDLHVTYSTERTCETLDLTGGRIVIYDQYLGQTFNQLNRLHLNGSDPEDMTTYGCKLLAERAQLLGCLEQSLAFAAAYRVRQHEASNAHREDRDLKKRLEWTLIQESYVVVHELFHSVLHRDPAWRAAAIRDARADHYRNRLLPIVQRAAREGEGDTAYRGSLGRQIALFLTSDALVEECVCDTLAVPVIWLMFKDQCDVRTIRSAIFFALRNLRLLALINHYGDTLLPGEHGRDVLEPYLVRTGFLQWMMQSFEPFTRTVSSDWDDAPFMAEQERHETLIADPVYGRLWGFVEDLRARSFAPPDYRAASETHARIDILIGNARLRRPSEAHGEAYFTHDLGTLDPNAYAARKATFLAEVDAQEELDDHGTAAAHGANAPDAAGPRAAVGKAAAPAERTDVEADADAGAPASHSASRAGSKSELAEPQPRAAGSAAARRAKDATGLIGDRPA